MSIHVAIILTTFPSLTGRTLEPWPLFF